MTEERNALAKVFAACWKDEELKARFMSDPKAVLAEHGMDVPANIDVNVVENTDNTVHITMPQAPAGAADLSDEELASAAGGWWTFAQGQELTNTNVCFCPNPGAWD